MHSAFLWLSIVASFMSGALWLYAAVLKVPTDILATINGLVGVDKMKAGFKKQAIWNSYAALATAAAALLQAAAMMTE
jgi:hypothetical protein